MSTEENEGPPTDAVEMSQEAGEWAVVAMACVAFADGVLDDAEVEKAKAIVTSTECITESVGPEYGEQRFLDTVERIRAAPETELEHLMLELEALAGRVTVQAHRDCAFQTLVAIASADRVIQPAERTMLLKLREMIGSELLVPMANLSV